MKKALLVGVGEYRDPALGPLPHALDDVRALAAALKAAGFETVVLDNPGADRAVDAVAEAVAGLGPCDSFLFFFRGRGFVSPGGDQVLACADDSADSLERGVGGVPLSVLLSLGRSGAGFGRAFIIDACRPDGADAAGALRRLNRVVQYGDYADGFCVLRPSDRLLPAFEFDDIGHGAFAQALLEHLGESGTKDVSVDERLASSLGARLAEIVSDHGGFALVNPLFDGHAVGFSNAAAPDAPDLPPSDGKENAKTQRIEPEIRGAQGVATERRQGGTDVSLGASRAVLLGVLAARVRQIGAILAQARQQDQYSRPRRTLPAQPRTTPAPHPAPAQRRPPAPPPMPAQQRTTPSDAPSGRGDYGNLYGPTVKKRGWSTSTTALLFWFVDIALAMMLASKAGELDGGPAPGFIFVACIVWTIGLIREMVLWEERLKPGEEASSVGAAVMLGLGILVFSILLGGLGN